MGFSIMQALEKTATDIRDWASVKLSAGLDKKVDKVQGKVLSDNNYSQTDKDKVANMPDNLVVIDNLLYLAQGNNPILDSAVQLPEGGGGGGGGGGSSANVTATVKSPQNFSVAFGAKEVWIEIEFTSDRISTGTAYIRDIDNNVLGNAKLSYGLNKINIADYIKGTLNTLYIACQDDYGNAAPNPLKYEIKAVKLTFVPSFNDAQAVTSDSFTVYYNIQGDGYKKIHFVFDGKDHSVTTTSSSMSTSESISLGSRTHGVYSLKVYAETILSADVNNPREDEIIKSEIYEYRVMYAIGPTPLISSVCTISSAEQYAPISIPFSVYDRDNDSPTVDLIISQNGVEYSRTAMVAPRNQRVTWPARVANLSDNFTLGKNFDFIISYKDAIPVKHSITITQSSMQISTRRENLLFELLAADKTNSSHKEWNSTVGDVQVDLENVNWDVQERVFTIVGEKAEGQDAVEIKQSYAIGTGWRTDEENNTALRLSGDARATIKFQPFATDWADGGATLEMEFAIRDVNDRAATPISCIYNNLGFKVTADTASLIQSNTPLVKCNYVDDEKVRIAFVLENYTGPRGNKVQLITAYLNGVLSSAVQFAKSDNVSFLQQNPAQYITVGSSDCSIDLYMMRFYDAPLSYNDIKSNYIADNRRHDLWIENDIYVENEIVFDRLVDKIPIIRTTGIRPTSKAETKSIEKGGEGKDRRVDVIYTNQSTLPVIQENRVKIHVQGTSSEGYIRKNYDLDFENNHQHAEGQMPTDYYCLKTDYAEATGTHNTGHANYVHNFYTKDKFGNKPPFNIDSRARTTIYGFPCVIFHRDSAGEQYTFAGKYNFNFSKDSENVFGFTATDDQGNRRYPRSQSWEFAENKYAPCKFLTDPDIMPEEGDDNNPGWKLCFEDRCKPESGGMNDFKELYRWVYSTNQAVATGSELDENYTGVDGKVYTHDTKEYRLAKFRKEFEEHFDLDFTLVYYVYTFVMLMVDQRAKNQFLTSWDGKIWHPWLYDNDFVNFLTWSL